MIFWQKVNVPGSFSPIKQETYHGGQSSLNLALQNLETLGRATIL